VDGFLLISKVTIKVLVLRIEIFFEAIPVTHNKERKPFRCYPPKQLFNLFKRMLLLDARKLSELLGSKNSQKSSRLNFEKSSEQAQ